MRPGAYMPPCIEDLGTLRDVTSAHGTLPTQTPLATMGMSSPGMTGGNSGNGGTGGTGGNPPGGTFTSPSANAPGPTHHVGGPGPTHHVGGPGPTHHVGGIEAHGSPTHHVGEVSPTGGSGGNQGTRTGHLPLPPAGAGAGAAGARHGGTLPFTGFAALLTGAVGAIGTGAGIALRRLSRKRTRDT